MTRTPARLIVLAVALTFASPGFAQTFQPPKFSDSYGYQPYNDRNPTGFNHPNNTGYGHYVYSPKLTGHRSSTLSYRRFKGY